MTQIVMTKQQVLDRLAEQRKVAELHDSKALTEHEKAERSALVEFRAELREALKWDYRTAAYQPEEDGRTYPRRGIQISRPQCPVAMVVRIDRALAHVEMSGLTKYTMSLGGVHEDLFRLVTWESNPRSESLCG